MRERQVHVAESQVMGRNAVAVVVALIQPVAILQLLGVAQGSESLDSLGIPHLATVWAVTILLAGATMLASLFIPDEADTRVLEIGTNALVAMVCAIHLLAVLKSVGWSGASWTVVLDTSLIVNCGGRAFFLARQIWWVAHRERGRA